MLTVENLSKDFTLHILNGKHIEACRDISFNVPQGSFLGLSGPSGAGKSTVLKCIYRTYLPSAGAVWYDSAACGRVDLATLPDRAVIDIRTREMGYVSQFLKVIPRVSALDVVMEPILARNGVSPAEARTRALACLSGCAFRHICSMPIRLPSAAVNNSGSILPMQSAGGRACCFWTSRPPLWTGNRWRWWSISSRSCARKGRP